MPIIAETLLWFSRFVALALITDCLLWLMVPDWEVERDGIIACLGNFFLAAWNRFR